MRHLEFAETSLVDLVRGLPKDLKDLLRDEIDLAKTEITNKLSRYARQAAPLAAGSLVAFIGLIVFLTALGVLLGFAFERAGLNPLLATFIGLGIIGLLSAAIGGILVLNAMNALSPERLKPRRTIASLKHMQGSGKETGGYEPIQREQEPGQTAAGYQEQSLATQDRIGDKLEEIGYRISPTGIKNRAIESVRARPYKWSLIALGSGLVGSLLVTNRLKQVYNSIRFDGNS